MARESGGFPLDWEYYNGGEEVEPTTEKEEVDDDLSVGYEPEDLCP